MTNEKKIKNLGWGIVVLSVWGGSAIWGIELFSRHFRHLELSHHMMQSLLQNQINLSKEYVQKTERRESLFKENLEQTESFLTQVQKENKKLRQKIQLLDKLSELENTISQLKERNNQVTNEMNVLKTNAKQLQSSLDAKKQEQSEEKTIQTLEEGRKLLANFYDKIRELKRKIKELKSAEQQQRIAAQRKEDKIKLLFGNNGYLVRNGQFSAVSPPPPSTHEKIKVDVSFTE